MQVSIQRKKTVEILLDGLNLKKLCKRKEKKSYVIKKIYQDKKNEKNVFRMRKNVIIKRKDS